MSQWQSILGGLSGTKEPSSPRGTSHKSLLIELALLAILVICLPFIIWWIWGCINNLGSWKVTDSSKTARKHYIKTWHGFTERKKVERHQQKRKELREKFRSMFAWKTTRADCSWMFWDPDGSKRAQFVEERNSTWLRHLPRWMRSRAYGSLEPMTGSNSNRLVDAEKGLIQSRPFHNSDAIRPSYPLDFNQLHQTTVVSSWPVDGEEGGTCIRRTGTAMNSVSNGSSTTVGTILRRRLSEGTSRVFAAESAETNRAVQSHLFVSRNESERGETSIPIHDIFTLPESIASFRNVTTEGCIRLDEQITPEGRIAPAECATLYKRITPEIRIASEERITPEECITPAECVTPYQRIASEIRIAPEERITSYKRITLYERIAPEDGNDLQECIAPGERIADHEILSFHNGDALQGTSILPGSIKAPDNISLCKSDEQQSSMLHSTPLTYNTSHLPTLMSNVISLNQTTEITPDAADQLEERLKSDPAQRAKATSESPNSKDTICSNNLAAPKSRVVIRLEISSQSSQSPLPPPFSSCRPLPRPSAHVGRILDDLRVKPGGGSSGHTKAVRTPNHWFTLERPEVEPELPLRPIHSGLPSYTPDSDGRLLSIPDMIRNFRERSVSYQREASHSGISTINTASEADAVGIRWARKPVPSRTYGSIKVAKLGNKIRAASAHFRKSPRTTPPPRTRLPAQEAAAVAISADDGTEWELDWDRELYETVLDVSGEGGVVGRKRVRFRETLSARYRQILRRVVGRVSEGPAGGSS